MHISIPFYRLFLHVLVFFIKASLQLLVISYDIIIRNEIISYTLNNAVKYVKHHFVFAIKGILYCKIKCFPLKNGKFLFIHISSFTEIDTCSLTSSNPSLLRHPCSQFNGTPRLQNWINQIQSYVQFGFLIKLLSFPTA